MKTKITLIIMSLFALIISCKTSLIVQDDTVVTDSRHQNLISYYLPKTMLKIRVPIEKAEFKKGLLDSIKDKDIRKIVLDTLYEKFEWKPSKIEEGFSIGEKIQFIPVTVPDTDKRFTITYNLAKSLSHSSGISLNKDGIITSGEFAQEDKTYEYVTKTVELLATALKAGQTLGADKIESVKGKKPGQLPKHIKGLIREVEVLIDAKSALLTNPTAGVSSIEPTKFRLDYLDKRILEIKHEILGYIKTTTYNLSFIYEPVKNENVVTLLSISESKGVIIPKINLDPAARLSLKEILKATTKDGSFKDLNLLIKESYSIKTPKKEFKNTKSFGKHFLVYNVPAKYSMEIQYDGSALKSFASNKDEEGTDIYEVYFPQRGYMAALPSDFKDLKVVYFEDIGAVKEVKYAKNASLNAASATAGFAALDSVISLRNKIKENKK